MAMERDNKPMRGRKRRKVCAFCADKVEQIDYKDAAKLRRFNCAGRTPNCRKAAFSWLISLVWM